MEKEQVELMEKPRTAMALRTHVYESAVLVLTGIGQLGGRQLMCKDKRTMPSLSGTHSRRGY
jgi:hypothetical protein